MTQCPCGSGQDLDRCCAPYIDGNPAPTAEALLRSRYTAYVLGNVDYIAHTMSMDIRDTFDQIEAENKTTTAERSSSRRALKWAARTAFITNGRIFGVKTENGWSGPAR